MKRSIIVIACLLLALMLAGGTAAAQQGKLNVKGEVIAVDGGNLTVESHKGKVYVFSPPEGFDLSTIVVGDSVLIRASAETEGVWQADVVVESGDGGQEGEGDDLVEEGTEAGEEGEVAANRENSAFCDEEKKDDPHPLAPKIADRYGVSEDDVMEYWCDGFSMGAIMLAIKTSQLAEVSEDIATLLEARREGSGWGQIWKELGLIGNSKNAESPPGQLKKEGQEGSTAPGNSGNKGNNGNQGGKGNSGKGNNGKNGQGK